MRSGFDDCFLVDDDDDGISLVDEDFLADSDDDAVVEELESFDFDFDFDAATAAAEVEDEPRKTLESW